jgi:hypothetical protein
MFWALLSRPLSTFLTLAGVALLSPVLLPLTKTLVKPLVKPVTNLYLFMPPGLRWLGPTISNCGPPLEVDRPPTKISSRFLLP